MNTKLMLTLVVALSLGIFAGAFGSTPAQATETQPDVAEIEIDTDTCTVFTGSHDPTYEGPAFAPVVLWVDANSDDYYGNGSDYPLGSGITDSEGDFSFDLIPGYVGTAGLQISGAGAAAEARPITDSESDFSFDLTPGNIATTDLLIGGGGGGAEPEARPRWHCWWVPCINDWVCLLY